MVLFSQYNQGKYKMKILNVQYLLISASIILILGFMSTVQAEEKAEEGHVWKIDDGVYRYGNPKFGYFSMFVVTDEGVVVIDPMNTGHSKGMLKAINNLTDQPVRYLVHTHNHWDHSKGGMVFREQGAKIIAHMEAIEWMSDNPHPELVLPDETWTGMQKEIILGGRVIELHYLGMNHGQGMTAILLPKEKIAYIADIVTPNRMLFSIADFNFKEWARSLSENRKSITENLNLCHFQLFFVT